MPTVAARNLLAEFITQNFDRASKVATRSPWQMCGIGLQLSHAHVIAGRVAKCKHVCPNQDMGERVIASLPIARGRRE